MTFTTFAINHDHPGNYDAKTIGQSDRVSRNIKLTRDSFNMLSVTKMAGYYRQVKVPITRILLVSKTEFPPADLIPCLGFYYNFFYLEYSEIRDSERSNNSKTDE